MAIATVAASEGAEIAAKKVAERKAKKVAAERAKDMGAGPKPQNPTDAQGNAAFRGEKKAAAKTGGGGKAGGGKKLGSKSLGWAWSGSRKILTAQFLLCMVILILGTLTGKDEAKTTAARALVKGSALSLLFFLLALLSSAGGSSARTATAMGTLVTAAYAFTSSDVHAVVTWVGHFFSHQARQAGTDETSAVESENAPEFS
ncbi:MAG: hypothetical protein ACJ786_36100 [Catenulispora sp.]|jgi:hypothetical protein